MLKYATFVYNNTVHSTTGYSPHELAHGFQIKIPSHLSKPKLSYNYDSLADFTRNNIAKALELARQHLYTKIVQNKSYYDTNASECDIKENDLVLFKTQTKKHKFENLYKGPFRVVDASDSYVTILKAGKRVKVHKNLLKKTQAEYETEPPLMVPDVSLDELINYIDENSWEIKRENYTHLNAK